eukprot:5767148-Alexandrium_andersonii.AAC.1
MQVPQTRQWERPRIQPTRKMRGALAGLRTLRAEGGFAREGRNSPRPRPPSRTKPPAGTAHSNSAGGPSDRLKPGLGLL